LFNTHWINGMYFFGISGKNSDFEIVVI
jgi:hypothetical protein